MDAPASAELGRQILWLFILSIPVACVAWTVTHEEVFREPREYCKRCAEECQVFIKRKFYYLFTCEYCFSHYVAAFFIWIAGFRLLTDDWRGYLFSFFAVVFVSNIYMSLYNRLRVDILSERAIANFKEKEVVAKEKEIEKLETEIQNNGADIKEKLTA